MALLKVNNFKLLDTLRGCQVDNDAGGAAMEGKEYLERGEGSHRWRSRGWRLYASLGVLAMGAYFLVPSPDAQTILYTLLGICAVAAVTLGILTHCPKPSLPWWLFALGLLLFVIGDGIWTFYETVSGIRSPFPSVADAFYLVAYPCVATGLVLMVRNRAPGREWTSLIDAMIVATSVGMCSWAFLMAPYAGDPKLSLIERLISIAYPVIDVLWVVVFVRLLSLPGKRPAAFYFLSAGLVFLLIADTVYATRILVGAYETGDPIDAWWLLSYALFGTSALHPSMVDVPEPVPNSEPKLTFRRFVFLVGTWLVVPAVLTIQAVLGEEINIPLIAGGSVALFALVAARAASMIREREKAEEALEVAERKYRILAERIPAVTYIQQPDFPGRTTYKSPQYEDILGYSPEEVLGALDHWVRIMHPDDREWVLAEDRRTNQTGEPFRAEYRQFAKDGRLVWIRDEATLVRGEEGQPLYWLGIQTDITERKALERELEHRALHDPLTDLPNRRLFVERLHHALGRTKSRPEHKVAVLFMDLDDFKVVNDSLGHEVGDELLVAVTKRLRALLRSGATIARLGGDEFAILLDYLPDADYPATVARRIIQGLRGAFFIGELEVFVNASIGIAISTLAGRDWPQMLMRDADAAMYAAKRKGRSCYAVFDQSMNQRALERLNLKSDLRRAIERKEFRLHYQPKVCLQTGEIAGMEALVRWEHPERGLVFPNTFIPLAEETGLIVPIGKWVLEEACRQATEWRARWSSRTPLTMSVNLSAKQFEHPESAQDIADILGGSGLDPRRLDLEITESVLMNDAPLNAGIMRELKAVGVELSIDDFGTGYSSLSYLKRFPVDYLKIDRSFIARLGEDTDEALVSGMIRLAHTLGFRVVAEGVQTAEQLARLRELGCDFAQGHYFSRPLPSRAAEALLTRKFLHANGRPVPGVSADGALPTIGNLAARRT